jgi:hypothetical protein
VERRLPAQVFVSADFIDRRGRDGFVYLPATPQAALFGGNFIMTNARRDHSDSLTFTVRHTFRKEYPLFAAYTRSRARTNAFLNYSVDVFGFGQEGPGLEAWDAPNRFIAWGMSPLPRLPLIHRLDFAYSVDYRTGYPFSVVNQNQQTLPPYQNYRFPDFLSVNPYIEKRVTLRGYTFAIRGGFDNVLNRRNPSAVNNNVDSTSFLTYSNFDRRTFVGRIRFLGKKK